MAKGWNGHGHGQGRAGAGAGGGEEEAATTTVRECAKFYSNLKKKKKFHQFNQYYTTHSDEPKIQQEIQIHLRTHT